LKNQLNIFIAVSLLITTVAFFSGCNTEKKEQIRIAVTKASSNYINWLKKGDSTLVIVNMYPLDRDSALKELDRCSGLLVTGGEDVQPEYYGKESEKHLCTETDPSRDTLEMALIRKAFELKMPVLGICRGEQIINVALGGSLIVDIPSHFLHLPRIYHIVHQCEDYHKCFHQVNIFPNTFLRSLTGCDKGIVTTNHHQAVDQLAPGLVSNARSEDGLTEGIEWESQEGKSFMIGVQWHPERMDTSNCLSGKLLLEFINRSQIYKNIK
jgi:putative glutamine amidotransferase